MARVDDVMEMTEQEEEYWNRVTANRKAGVPGQNFLNARESRIRNGSEANNRQVGGDHYKDMGVEPWDVVDTWPLEQRIGAYRHGALKYLMRMGSKDEQLQEIKKCGHYIEKLIEVLESA